MGPPPSRTPLGNGCACDCRRHRGMHRLPVHTGLGHQPIPPSMDWSLPPTGPSYRWWLTHGFKWYVDKRFVCIVLCLFYCVLEDSNRTENLLLWMSLLRRRQNLKEKNPSESVQRELLSKQQSKRQRAGGGADCCLRTTVFFLRLHPHQPPPAACR